MVKIFDLTLKTAILGSELWFGDTVKLTAVVPCPVAGDVNLTQLGAEGTVQSQSGWVLTVKRLDPPSARNFLFFGPSLYSHVFTEICPEKPLSRP
jgi:hypothetical protein